MLRPKCRLQQGHECMCRTAGSKTNGAKNGLPAGEAHKQRIEESKQADGSGNFPFFTLRR